MNESTQNHPATTDTDTRSALRRAARPLFAEHGYEAASVRAITAAAGANLGAITYHFGSKRTLYEQVVDDVMGPLADRIVAAATSGRAPLDCAAEVVRAFFGYFAEHQDVPKLMLQELANGREFPPAAQRHLLRMIGALTALVEAGQADGSMRPGPARFMALAIVSHPLHLHIVRAPLQQFAQIDIAEPGTRERIVENAVRFVRGGLAAWPPRMMEP